MAQVILSRGTTMTALSGVHKFCCVILATCFVAITTGDSSCAFPEFLLGRKHEHWLYKVRLDEHKSGIKAYSLSATRSLISFAPYYPADNQNSFFEWKCITQFKQDSYFIAIVSGEATRYKCIEFVHLSNEVKRFKISQDIMYDNDDACDVTARQWDPWLLVRGGSAPFDTVPCSLTGGFNLQVTEANVRMCDKLHLTPRLEIGCFEADKMYFDFQNCPHERFTPLMDRRQVLLCIAQWSDDTHKFVVMRKLKSDSYWILIFPSRSVEMNSFTASLSSEITSDLTNTQAMSLHLAKNVITNICTDAADDCTNINTNRNELCGGMYGSIYCKRTCKNCSPENEPDCWVDRDAVGQWEFVADDVPVKKGGQRFTVSERNFKTKLLLNTTCLTHGSDNDYHDYVFVKYQDNGCYPRFSCISSHVVNRAMYFKETRGATWPQYEEDYYCSARTYDFLPSEPRWRVAVKQRSSLSPVLCNIPMDLYDFETTTDSAQCHGRLQTSLCSALRSTGFSIMFNQSDSCNLVDVHFDCISSKIYEEPGDKRVAILARDQESVYYCFIFDIRFTGVTRIPAHECHEEFIFWDHTELQQFDLAPSGGLCIERKSVVHSGVSVMKQSLFIPGFLTVFNFLLQLLPR